jgi:hypothetical protein
MLRKDHQKPAISPDSWIRSEKVRIPSKFERRSERIRHVTFTMV